MAHPSILVADLAGPGTRSVEDLRRAVRSGHAATLWRIVEQACEDDIRSEPLVPESVFPGRDLKQARWANRDWTVCRAAGDRVKRAALAALISGDRRYVDEALRQAATLFDERKWPRWRDKATAHTRFPADLRTGMLSKDLGFAYDWLYRLLSAAERDDFLAGIDRCGIVPFFESVDADAWWLHSMHNWTTCVVGGLGIAGMALGEDHPRGRELVDYSRPIMEKYLECAYGPEGEFNESVGYASATELPMVYFAALESASGGREDIMSDSILREALTWYQYFVVPPGRVVAFGDAHLDAPPATVMFALAARVWRDGVFQWFYLNHQKGSSRRDYEFELLWYDPDVAPEEPSARLPKGRRYTAYGACVSSRSSWDPDVSHSVVCGKAGMETNHEHHDVGQLVIDGFGRRLIVDLGSPSGYPEDFFGPNRFRYYNASSHGHNVVTVAGREMSHDVSGSYAHAELGDAGGCWRVDLTPCYPGARTVSRGVVHLYPGIVAVVDDIGLPEPAETRLRWHPVSVPEVDDAGGFTAADGSAAVHACVVALVGRTPTVEHLEPTVGHHRYEPPFDKARSGEKLDQRHEPYLDYVVETDRVRFLSMFAVCRTDEEVTPWHYASAGAGRRDNNGDGDMVYEITTGGTGYRVVLSRDALLVTGVTEATEVSLPLPS